MKHTVWGLIARLLASPAPLGWLQRLGESQHQEAGDEAA